MIRLALCDDVKQDMDRVREYILSAEKEISCNEKFDITCFENGEDVVEEIMAEPEKYDAIIMDVQLGGMTGKEAVARIRQMNSEVLICIMSRNELPVPADFRLNTFRYIMKDDELKYIKQDIKSILEECVRARRNKYLFFDTMEGSIKVKTDNILYISKIKRGSELHIKGRDDAIRVKEQISDIEEKLKEHGFGYAHNSYMINYRAVTAFMDYGKSVKIENGEVLGISRRYKESFMKGHLEENER